jgi:membrane protein DedA with SNARE-associated domain
MTSFPARKFFLLDGIGASVWVLILSILGYVFGGVLETAFGRLRHYEILLVSFVILAFVGANFLLRFCKLLLKKMIQ